MPIKNLKDTFTGEPLPTDSGEPTGSTKTGSKSTKAEKEDRLLQNYISHLNLVINWGGYNEFLDAKEVIKMAQIKSHMEVSKHPQILGAQSLYNRVVSIVRARYSAPDVERWFKG